MINKIICFLFGHVFFSEVFTGKVAIITSKVTYSDIKVPCYRLEQNEVCPRCGKIIEWKAKKNESHTY